MPTTKDQMLEERLNRHPALRGHVERLLEVVEATGENVKRADDAERKVVEIVRQVGQESLSGWARNRVEQERSEGIASPDWRSAGKKTLLANNLRYDRGI